MKEAQPQMIGLAGIRRLVFMVALRVMHGDRNRTVAFNQSEFPDGSEERFANHKQGIRSASACCRSCMST
jgi:hypothetical protein